VIETSIDGLFLEVIKTSDTDELFDLVQANRSHLTQNGDYSDIVEMSREKTKAAIEAGQENTETFGLRYYNKLIGTVSLICHADRIFGLGYWIAAEYSGNGYMTKAVRAIIDMACRKKQAKEVWAGITPSNIPSIKLVSNLGFHLAREQSTHKSYKLEISDNGFAT